MGILLALVSSVVWGTSDFVGGLLSRRLPTYFVVAASQAAGLTAVTIAVLVTGAFRHEGGWLFPAVIGGATLAVGLVAFYEALSTGTMGIVSPIAALGVLVPVVVGLAQGDAPSAVTSAGVVLALVGAVAASGPELSGGAGRRPVALAALAGVSFGTAMVFLARGAQASPLMTLWGMRATSVTGMVLLAVAFAGLRARATVGRRDLALVVVAGAGDASANLLFSLASLRGYISVVSVLASLYPVVTVLLARLLLHERMLRVQVAGVVAALGGVVLVSVG